VIFAGARVARVAERAGGSSAAIDAYCFHCPPGNPAARRVSGAPGPNVAAPWRSARCVSGAAEASSEGT